MAVEAALTRTSSLTSPRARRQGLSIRAKLPIGVVLLLALACGALTAIAYLRVRAFVIGAASERIAQAATRVSELLAGCDHCIAGAALIGGIAYFHTYAYDLLAQNERIIAATCDAAIKAFEAGRLQKVTYLSSSMVFESASTWPSYEGQQREIGEEAADEVAVGRAVDRARHIDIADEPDRVEVRNEEHGIRGDAIKKHKRAFQHDSCFLHPCRICRGRNRRRRVPVSGGMAGSS